MKILSDVADVTTEVLEAAEATCDWFEGERGLNTEEFINRLCDSSLNYATPPLDIEDYSCPAVKKIMQHAIAIRTLRSYQAALR